MMQRMAMVLASLLVGGMLGWSDTFTVTRGTGQYPTLTSAINAVNSAGDGPHTIELPVGLYSADTGESYPLLLTSSEVTVRGAGSGWTVLDGKGQSRILVVGSSTARANRFTLEGITFRNGFCATTNHAGGLTVYGHNTEVSDSSFENNRAVNGGGLAVYGNSETNSTATLTSIAFHNNIAQIQGGGANLERVLWFMNRCWFEGNEAGSSEFGQSMGFGGGLGVAYGTGTVTNSVFVANKGHAYIGGTGAAAIFMMESDRLNFYHSVVHNHTVGRGVMLLSVHLHTTNSIFSNNTEWAIVFGDHECTGHFYNNLFYENGAHMYDSQWGRPFTVEMFNDPMSGEHFEVWGANNIEGNPLYVSTNIPFDLRLTSGSPAIGHAITLTPSVIEDFDGNVRPYGTSSDVGAFEWGQLAPTMTATIVLPTPVQMTPTPIPTIPPTEEPTPECCVGDANNDGMINQNDYRATRDNFGTSGPFPLLGDANCDGIVNQNDYRATRDHFGQSCP